MPKPYLPAEWAPQSAVLLTWPGPDGDWGDRFLAVQQTFLVLAREISARERLIISCPDDDQFVSLPATLDQAGAKLANTALHCCPSNDVWVRDHGPMTVLVDATARLLDFEFDGWGNKYPAELDNKVTTCLHAKGAFGHLPLIQVDLVLEGGSIECDGAGTLITTDRCLIQNNRNSGLNRSDYEALFRDHLGIDRVIWLNHGVLDGDDTGGHIDTLVRFAKCNTLVYQACADPEDANYTELAAMADELNALTTTQGKPYRLVALPSPRPKVNRTGNRLPASYVNFLITNGAVLMPAYDDPADEEVRMQLKRLFPDRDIIPIPALPLIEQFGSVHCATMHMPAANPGNNQPHPA